MFETLRRWFDVPTKVALDLTDVDAAVVELGEPVMIAALAMRKLQALRLLSTPGVRTTTDVVVTIVQDLQRALIQAPNMRLNVAAASTDWDAELAALGVDEGEDDAPVASDELDPETERFNELHARLQQAMIAVIEASEGEIRYLE
jgi:hypothetical protein